MTGYGWVADIRPADFTEFVHKAFIWSNTPEGADFWYKVACEQFAVVEGIAPDRKSETYKLENIFKI